MYSFMRARMCTDLYKKILVVHYSIISLSLKFHKDPIFRCLDIWKKLRVAFFLATTNCGHTYSYIVHQLGLIVTCYWREQFCWNWYNNKVKRSTLSFCFNEKLMQIIRGEAKTSSLTNSPSKPCTPRPTKTRNTPRSTQRSASKDHLSNSKPN